MLLSIWAVLVLFGPGGTELTLQKGPFSETVVLPGFLAAETSEQLLAPRTNSWQIQLKWLEEEGLEVDAGQVVARFDDSGMLSELAANEQEIITQIQSMKSDQAQFQDQIREAELALLRARIDWDKAKLDAVVPEHLQEARLYQEHQLAATRAEKVYLEAESKLALLRKKAEDQTKIAQSQLQSKKEDYALLQKRISQLELKANQAGLVVHANHLWEGRKLQVNDTVQAGWTVVEIPQMDTLYVKAWVTEFEREKVVAGQPVQVVLDAYKDQVFNAEVKSLDPSAQKHRNWGETPLFAVQIALEKVEVNIMRPGMSARAEITTLDLSDVWQVPLQAVVFDRGSFWVKPLGQSPQQVQILGKNAFFLAIEPVEGWDTGLKFERAPFEVQGGEP